MPGNAVDLAGELVEIKRCFARDYTGHAHIQEAIPSPVSEKFQSHSGYLAQLHDFAIKNPIYLNHYTASINGTCCTVYEGDINQYWLNSIKHGSSCQPFYPTWIMSAYVLANTAKEMGYTELVDIGSGDGRIAFCGTILGQTAHSIEIDDVLAGLQDTICQSTKQNFHPECMDALEFDYSRLRLVRPVFFIGGLPQMGGDILAAGIIDRIKSIPDLKENTCIVFAGTNARRELSGDLQDGGWSSLISRYNLKVLNTVSLPTIWTFDQAAETPYIYTTFN